MRKSNSDFRTAFVSETGSQLVNNDYFAFVELDDYACYVIASGITDFKESQGAKRAVENILLSFQEQPGMSKMALKRYLQDANDRLVASASREKLRASVVVVVTDYE
ncbi:MAG: protein phosphatase, partial [Selenomonas sp.]|nr:protein phosphatase [Selenomonas sp.]